MSGSSTTCEQDTSLPKFNLNIWVKKRHNEFQLNFLCARELKSLSHLKEKIDSPPPQNL